MSSKQLIYGCLVNSQNHCPEGTTTTMTMVDYCPRPMAERNSPSGHPRHRGAVVLTIHQTAMHLLFYCPTKAYLQKTMKI